MFRGSDVIYINLLQMEGSAIGYNSWDIALVKNSANERWHNFVASLNCVFDGRKLVALQEYLKHKSLGNILFHSGPESLFFMQRCCF